jgi:hypothetical protein
LADGYTWETYNRGKYREKKMIGPDINTATMTPAVPANQGLMITGQTPTTPSQNTTAPGQDPLTPRG